ncbi:hypothetical protein [Spirosoma telluris]|uniref:hypothetical protein n=1 Tax=Spirosoma telluris TaxID=2183553 RepID=UPI0013146C74
MIHPKTKLPLYVIQQQNIGGSALFARTNGGFIQMKPHSRSIRNFDALYSYSKAGVNKQTHDCPTP